MSARARPLALAVALATAAACSRPNPAFAPALVGDGGTEGPGNDGAGGDGNSGEPDRPPSADAAPDVVADLVADLAGDWLPDLAPDGEPDLAPHAQPDLAPDVEVDLAPDAEPDLATMDVSPRRLVLTGGAATQSYGGPAGVAHTDNCEGDQVLVGYQGSVEVISSGATVVRRLEGRCGEVVVTGGPPFALEIRPGPPLPPRGGAERVPFSALCPANQVVVSFFGRGGSFLDQVGFRCAPLTISDDAASTVVIGSPTVLGPFGGEGGRSFDDGCPAGNVARGHQIRDGFFIDAFALRCSKPSIAP